MTSYDDRVKILTELINAVSEWEIGRMLQKTVPLVHDVTSADNTDFYILDHKSDAMLLRASTVQSGKIGSFKVKFGEGITGWVAKTGDKAVLEKDAPKDSRFMRVPGLPGDLCLAYLSVPIKSREVTVGVINIKNEEPKEFKTSEVNTIQLIARLLGPAVERGVLLEELGDFEEALETQAVLHKAKEMVMKRKDMSENDAYHAIRRRAIGDESSLREIAEAIIVSDVLV